MRKSFIEYMLLKESKEKNNVTSEVKLSKDSDFQPFNIGDDKHPNLKPVVKAFLDSDKVPYPGPGGYPEKLTTINGDEGEITPKLKKKNIYLTGGAVRDHLKGKTPKDYDLVTDATPDEVRLILTHAGFAETKPEGTKNKKYDKLSNSGNKRKSFFAKGWDRSGREFIMGVRVNGEDFEIATFRKDAKSGGGKLPEKMEFGGLEDDAQKRDFTMNSMYIPLTTADGANSKLIDPHGGAHHLKSGEVVFVGNPKERLEEDQMRALRYIRFAAMHGKGEIPADIKAAIEEIKDLPSVDKQNIRDEFLKGLEHPDIDTKKYIKMYKDSGLLGSVFKNADISLNNPEDYSDTKDKRLALAWLLRKNPSDKIQKTLGDSAWPEKDVGEISYLVDLLNWGGKKNNETEFYDKFYDLKERFNKTNFVPSMIRKWAKMNNMDEKLVDNFLKHEKIGRAHV